MNSKIKTYLLIIGVLIVWTIIGYMIITGIDSDLPEVPQQNMSVVFSPKTNKEIDTFSIQNVDRDPFLGTLSHRKKDNNKSARQNLTEGQLQIKYKGLIQKQNSSEKVFAVHIKNTEYLLREGQTIDKIKLVSGNQKSIKVLHDNRYQTIIRQ